MSSGYSQDFGDLTAAPDIHTPTPPGTCAGAKEKILIVLLTTLKLVLFFGSPNSDESKRHNEQMQRINSVHYGCSPCLISNIP